MAQILVRNLETKVVNRLKKKAASNHRSLQAEVKRILEEEALGTRLLSLAEFRRRADAISAQINPAIQTDSTLMIREDRDR